MKNYFAQVLALGVIVASKAADEYVSTMTMKEAQKKHFPEAMSGKKATELVAQAMKKNKMSAKTTVFAESSCPDELNHDSLAADISMRLGEHMGEVFILGGLAGVPFTGTGGWGAFSGHVPDNGNIFVLYAPHVGITNKGQVGYVHRPGMKGKSSACGSAIGAFNALKNNPLMANASPAAFDYQQSYMMEALGPRMETIQAAEGDNKQMEELARETFNVVKQVLYDIIGTDHSKWMKKKGKLMLLGGIMLNMDGEGNDMFAPQSFTVMGKDGKEKDLMKSFKRKAKKLRIRAPQKLNSKLAKKNAWKTKPNKEQLAALAKHFPTALPGATIEKMAYKTLQGLGYSKKNTVFTYSSCPDELNHDSYKEDVTKIMSQRWGESFPLGGLAGIPFTGKTGWGAFTHHVPDNGNIFAMYGPHVGVDKTGIVGKVHRPGMKKASKACGASIGAFLTLNKGVSSVDSKHDQQFNYILKELSPRMGKINAIADEHEQQAQLSYDTFNIAHHYGQETMNGKWMKYGPQYATSSWAWIGGITINMDGKNTDDMFVPLTFGYEHANGTKVDLMEQTFGVEAVQFAATKVEDAGSSMMTMIIIIILVLVVLIVIIVIVKKHMSKDLGTVHTQQKLEEVDMDSARADGKDVNVAPGTADPMTTPKADEEK